MNQGWVAVSVPATTANLGPGYDFLGAALEWRDHYRAWISPERLTECEPAVTVAVSGHAASQDVPRDASNLVAATMLRGLREWGCGTPAEVRVECRNEIPHGRGMGSSSAAIVGGLGLALACCPPDSRPPLDAVLQLAAAIEGHPDNVAPAVLGGFTPTWTDESGAHALRLDPHQRIRPVVAVPATTLATSKARGMMPEAVPLSEATFNASRASLLVWALTHQPDLLLAATADQIHQDRRAPAYPASAKLVQTLRRAGLPAVVSGAGPAVLILSIDETDEVVETVRQLAPGWDVRAIPFAAEGLVIATELDVLGKSQAG